MQIIRKTVSIPRGGPTYSPTHKELSPEDFSRASYAYWNFAGKIEEKFGSIGETFGEIYDRVLRPMGLSLDDARTLLDGAIREGYLKKEVRKGG